MLSSEVYSHQSVSPLYYDKSSVHNGNTLGADLHILDRIGQKFSKKSTSSSKDDTHQNHIQPTKTLDTNFKMANVSDLENDIVLSKYAHFAIGRDARFLTNVSSSAQVEKPSVTSLSIQPTSTEALNSALMSTAARQYPNPDIQDIITGIVKLLNGNVNVHANANPQFQATRKVYASRINNRGPPRISELPDYSVVNIEKEHEIPQKISTPQINKAPTNIPYPFDMPTNPIRNTYSGVQLPDQLFNSKPNFVTQQQNRPPWQRHRPRPPIITNTNRLPVIPSPPTFKLQPPARPMPDHRPPNREYTTLPATTNPLTTERIKFQQTNPINATEQSYITDKYENTNPIDETTEIDMAKETIKKVEKPKKPNKISTSIVKEKETNTIEIVTQPQIVEHSTETMIPTIENNTPSLPLNIDDILDNVFSSESSADSTNSPVTTTPELPVFSLLSTSSDKLSISKMTDTTEILQIKTSAPSPLASSLAPTSMSNAVNESTSLPAYHPRPGIVLDDTEFNKALKTAAPTKVIKEHHQTEPVNSMLTMSNVYGEIFDVTLSAIQGPGNKPGAIQTTYVNPHNIKLYGTDGNDIIVSASGDDSFVSIDGKRTYINLFGESVETKVHPKTESNNTSGTIQPTKTVVSKTELTL